MGVYQSRGSGLREILSYELKWQKVCIQFYSAICIAAVAGQGGQEYEKTYHAQYDRHASQKRPLGTRPKETILLLSQHVLVKLS